ncbi:MAG: glycosyltransferase family 2 protein [Candidatus Brocadiia bacterium]
MSPPRLSIVVPARDEEDNILPLVQACREGLGELYAACELILVDDGSADHTLDRMKDAAAAEPAVRWLALDTHCGQSAALDAGFQAARGELVAMMDADLQNDPADLPPMVELVHRGECECVCGIRQNRQDNWLRRVSSRIANATRNWFTGDHVTDVGCSLRVMRRDVLARVKMFHGMHRFLPALLRLEGARIREVPVRHRPRLHGKTKYGVWNRLFRGLRDIFAVRWMRSRNLRYTIRESGPPPP